jgi:hypothetical protein
MYVDANTIVTSGTKTNKGEMQLCTKESWYLAKLQVDAARSPTVATVSGCIKVLFTEQSAEKHYDGLVMAINPISIALPFEPIKNFHNIYQLATCT